MPAVTLDTNLIMLTFQALAGLSMLIVIMITAVLIKIWSEIGKLRAERHAIRNLVAENHNKLLMIEFSVEDAQQDVEKYRVQLVQLERQLAQLDQEIKKLRSS